MVRSRPSSHAAHGIEPAPATGPYAELREKLLRGGWSASVFGVGYVGLPLVAALADRGVTVTGFDISRARVDALNSGEAPLDDIDGEALKRHQRAGLVRFTADPAEAAGADVVFVCVPTPLDESGRPDMSCVAAAAADVARTTHAGQLICVESTTYPGTTREVFEPALRGAGWTPGSDVFLAYSPERINPTDTSYTVMTTTRLVGGLDEASLDLALLAYRTFVREVRPMSSTEVAELTKLFENSFRLVNISLVNEMAKLCQDLGVDVWEVIAGASTKPYGFLAHYPGPGVGGHCIPVDPEYLVERARELGSPHTSMIERALEINRGMVDYVQARVAGGLERRGKSLEGARVLVLGVAYKRNSRDVRQSPGADLVAALQQAGADVRYHDSWVPELRAAGLESVPLTAGQAAAADAVVLATDHDDIDLPLVARNAQYVLDTRNVFRRAGIQGDHIEVL